MTIAVGSRIPDVTVQEVTPDGGRDVSIADFCARRTILLFGVPGAFTATCSEVHLPGFVVRSEELATRGVDAIVCTAVNDAAVMRAWAGATGADRHLTMLADGNGDLARALGVEFDGTRFGLGIRSRRYAAVIEDRVVRYLGVESGPEVGVSSADAVLAALSGQPRE